ncbi:WLM domain-containing protein [Mycena chlorophos]|uniref:WLM domain-containing protein n=1 Tax=Mycena chlorophos TaxID=658473 RepID=A0A8H6SQI7_MYCCL|nr:WLM domain-containing protein [Mycena chlorophos]
MSTDVFVKSFTHVKGPPKQEARALEMLKRIASLVKPIMRKHGWVLPVLSEFFPQQSNLLGLNVNGGQKILLRLRPAHAPDTFMDEDDVVQTMLHELTHNVHGPHDEKFYKFLAGLQDEYDALQRSGYAGEGFYSKGNRLGTNVSHDLPPHLARAKAIEAAEKRRQMAQVLGGGGGRRLGSGRLDTANLSPRELAARAAERRARDEKECGHGSAELAQREADKAAAESVKHDVIDLTLDSDDDEIKTVTTVVQTKPVPGPSTNKPKPKPAVKSRPVRPAPSSAAANANAPPSAWTCSVCTFINTPAAQKCDACLSSPPKDADASASPPPKKARTAAAAPASASVSAEWTCSVCTLVNPTTAHRCDACMTERPPGPDDRDSAGWGCLVCGETGMPHEFWSCRSCGSIKATSARG